jgi:MoxR-like ATPase
MVMLKPLDRHRRDSTLYQFTSWRLRDCIDPDQLLIQIDEQFDFAFQPAIDERQVKELDNLAFVSEAANILLLGPPGVGKTHLAVALALKTIEHGQGAYFVRA